MPEKEVDAYKLEKLHSTYHPTGCMKAILGPRLGADVGLPRIFSFA